MVNRYDNDSYGNFDSKVEDVANPYTFTAREFDPESGLYFYRARYYDPVAGRFISEDPIGFEGNDLNLHRYVLNNPVNLIDPSGQLSFIEQTGIAAVVIFEIALIFEFIDARKKGEKPSLCRVAVFTGFFAPIAALLFAASVEIATAAAAAGGAGVEAAVLGGGVGVRAFKAFEGGIKVTVGICGEREPG